MRKIPSGQETNINMCVYIYTYTSIYHMVNPVPSTYHEGMVYTIQNGDIVGLPMAVVRQWVKSEAQKGTTY